MERMKVRLPAEQAARLRQLARKQRVPMTKLIRDAVDRVYGTDTEPSLDEKWERAMRDLKQRRGVILDRMIGIYTGSRNWHFDGLDVLPVTEFLRQLHQGKVF